MTDPKTEKTEKTEKAAEESEEQPGAFDPRFLGEEYEARQTDG